jgi:hypothetical protein
VYPDGLRCSIALFDTVRHCSNLSSCGGPVAAVPPVAAKNRTGVWRPRKRLSPGSA